MPTFDGGHYFLTVLIPISTKHVRDGTTVTSPVHALRKRLDMLPTVADKPASAGGVSPSPFARNTRNHFARVAIIDDVAYTGRTGRNTLINAAAATVLTDAQPHQEPGHEGSMGPEEGLGVEGSGGLCFGRGTHVSQC